VLKQWKFVLDKLGFGKWKKTVEMVNQAEASRRNLDFRMCDLPEVYAVEKVLRSGTHVQDLLRSSNALWETWIPDLMSASINWRL
jgi:hypothetical protein